MFDAKEIYDQVSPHVAKLTTYRLIGEQMSEIGTGSGFLVGGYLVTCGHNITEIAGQKMAAIFPQANARNGDSGGLNYENPLPHIKAYSAENSYDYAALEATLEPIGLQFSDRAIEVGEPVCALGFSFSSHSLNIHQGIIGSIGKSGVADMLTLDMSVNPGNSGGPLISMIDGKVIGIVVRKATGLDTAFDNLVSTMNDNLKVLREAEEGVVAGGFSFKDTVAALQTQIATVATQMKRSAMVGIGYAISIRHLREDVLFSPE